MTLSRFGSDMERDTAGQLALEVRALSTPLRDDSDLDPLLERIGQAHFVLLGEATHGTSEFYSWRHRLSARLIQEKEFSFIAVEGDWPDCYKINRYVKGFTDAGSDASETLHTFSRWPTWMWANREVMHLVEGLRRVNQGRKDEEKVGFYGLDVYSLRDSMRAVIEFLDKTDPAAAKKARQAYACFEPYREDGQEYAWATRFVSELCEDEAVEMLMRMRRHVPFYQDGGREAKFDAEQNALVVRNAELYHRTMIRGGPDSWNVRDRHMTETLDRLMNLYGPNAKAIVWEHNTHIGDARATDMADEGMVNVGQLVRESYGSDEVVLVGAGTYHGSVVAGRGWEEPMEKMEVPPAREGSWEDVFHRAGPEDRLLLTAQLKKPLFHQPRGHRAIGVVYHPERERMGNYVSTILPQRYDAFLYVDRTHAVHPFHWNEDQSQGDLPKSYPWNE